MLIRKAAPKDAAAVAEIYNYYVANTAISFEEAPVDGAEMERRIRRTLAAFPFLVCEENGVQGYAYLSPWKARVCYRYTAEVSIYLRRGLEGRGLGSRLMERLIGEAREAGLHALTACITLPNPASVGLHEKYGFKQRSCFSEVGFKAGRWLDVGDWELRL